MGGAGEAVRTGWVARAQVPPLKGLPRTHRLPPTQPGEPLTRGEVLVPLQRVRSVCRAPEAERGHAPSTGPPHGAWPTTQASPGSPASARAGRQGFAASLGHFRSGRGRPEGRACGWLLQPQTWQSSRKHSHLLPGGGFVLEPGASAARGPREGQWKEGAEAGEESIPGFLAARGVIRCLGPSRSHGVFNVSGQAGMGGTTPGARPGPARPAPCAHSHMTATAGVRRCAGRVLAFSDSLLGQQTHTEAGTASSRFTQEETEAQEEA